VVPELTWKCISKGEISEPFWDCLNMGTSTSKGLSWIIIIFPDFRKSAAIKAAGCFSVGFGPKFGKNGFSQRQLLSDCGLLYDYSI